VTLWVAVLLACGACFGLKWAGYLLPAHWVAGDRTSRVTTLVPVALLAGLLVVQTVGGGAGALVVDARLAAVGVAVVLLLLRANFVLVVLAAAVVAAGLRAVGWG
jgi:hypothetical protein